MGGEVMARFRPGLELIKEGKCPLGATLSATCWVCQVGHATECHYPYTCEEARCSHYQRNAAIEKGVKNGKDLL